MFKICVIGMGYVGLPLINSLNKKFSTIGFDINKQKIKQLNLGFDENCILNKNELKKIKFTYNLNDLKDYNFYISCVPTPVKKNKKPDLQFVKSACNIIAKVIKKNDTVIFESTYSPFTTNHYCGNIIKKKSRLIPEKDFYLGYSPERINPGDKKNEINKISKIISANNIKTLSKLKIIYSKVTKNIHIAENIEIAESAKIIENIQRDINIAFFNELNQIFDSLKINSTKVFEAAGTKWNFNLMKPGLVGGHCIPVDPYYFYDFLKKKKINSKFIISGRNINENYEKFIIKKIKKHIINQNFNIRNILFLGKTYKPEVPDIRNSKALNIISYFKKQKKYKIFSFDPLLERKKSSQFLTLKKYVKNADIIIILTDHKFFNSVKIKKILNTKKVYNINK